MYVCYLNIDIFFRSTLNYFFLSILRRFFNFLNDYKGLNKFDSIPVETSEILQAVKNLNLVNNANRNESFYRIPAKIFWFSRNWPIFDNTDRKYQFYDGIAILSPEFCFRSSSRLSEDYVKLQQAQVEILDVFDTNYDRKADFKLFKSRNNSKFNS